MINHDQEQPAERFLKRLARSLTSRYHPTNLRTRVGRLVWLEVAWPIQMMIRAGVNTSASGWK